MSELAIIWREYTGASKDLAVRVPFAPDGFINATEMAKAFEETPEHWLRSKRAGEYISAVAEAYLGEKTGNVEKVYSTLVVVRRGTQGEQGTGEDLNLEEFAFQCRLIEKLEKRIEYTLSEFTNLRACAVDCLKMLPGGYDQWPIQEAIANLQSRVPPRDFDFESSLLALEHLIYDDGIIAESIAKARG